MPDRNNPQTFGHAPSILTSKGFRPLAFHAIPAPPPHPHQNPWPRASAAYEALFLNSKGEDKRLVGFTHQTGVL